MRIPRYLSPTSLMKWEESQEEFYLQYLADQRPPRFKQTEPMAVGSAFDAHIKSYFHDVLFNTKDPRFEFTTIFEDQVEEHNRDWALVAGKYCFDCYKTSGALADLLVELQQSQSEPKFEFVVEGEINRVPLLGKPDVWYVHKQGRQIILDWKVNGFCSKYPKSPNRGYVRCRDGWDGVQSKSHNTMHKDCTPMRVDGVVININEYLETIEKSWGLQLCTYAWLMGAKVGGEFICALDQLACSPDVDPDRPKIRIAEHRLHVGKEFQGECVQRYTELWSIINSNHIFRDMSFEESAARCAMLDVQYEAFEDGNNFIKEMTGRD